MWGSQQSETQTCCSPLLSVADSIEPFQQYNISVYPLYKDAVGTPAHIAAYSKQKGVCPSFGSQRAHQPHLCMHVPIF